MKVLNKKDNPQGEHLVYIGRGSDFGNPFTMESHRFDRDLVVELYTEFLCRELLTNRGFCAVVQKLEPFHSLVCHCAPERCHGHVLAEFVSLQYEYGQDEAIKLFVARKKYKHLPELDGVRHINIYSKSSSPLGKMLSHFHKAPFEHPTLGKFMSMEGFWYYLSSGCKHENLRELYGFEAKKEGQNLERVPRDDFLPLVEEANECKIKQNPEILEAFTKNTLPFMHYYFYGAPHSAAVRKLDNMLPAMFYRIRDRLVETKTTIIAGSRDFSDLQGFEEKMATLHWPIKAVIEGGAKGADNLGYQYARKYSLPHQTVDADWKNQGKGAGHIRNRKMADMADAAVVFRKNMSPGSTNMINTMRELLKPVAVFEYK